MEFENLMELIRTVSASDISELELQQGDWRLAVKRAGDGENRTCQETAGTAAGEAKDPGEKEADPPTGSVVLKGNVVKSPLVGTFYRAASPQEPPFVEVGDYVKKGQVLGLVEAMKLMNEIESEYEGRVAEILLENERMAEYGQPLFVIE